MAIVKREVIDNKVKCLIKSSNLLETVYDPDNKILNITFRSGRVYQYKNIEPKVYQQFELAESHGKIYHKLFKPLPTTRLADIDPNPLLIELNAKG